MAKSEFAVANLERLRDDIVLFQRICEGSSEVHHLLAPLYMIIIMFDKLIQAEMTPDIVNKPEFAKWYNPYVPLPPDVRDDLRACWNSGEYLTVSQLARAKGLPIHRVRNALIQMGVLKPRRTEKTTDRREQVLALFLRQQTISLSQIKKETGLSNQTIASILDEAGLRKPPELEKELTE